ncbi:MAG: hypothetical protein ABIN97_04585 [Ginsengibacter sp.]
MRYKLFSFFFFLILFSCNKVNNEPDRLTVDLLITNTSTLKTGTPGSKIISQVKCIEPNTCYEFSHLEIKQINPRQFEIRAKGTIPNSNKGDLICLEVLRVKDTTAEISAAVTGQYLLHFYNSNNLFKTDTVIVN